MRPSGSGRSAPVVEFIVTNSNLSSTKVISVFQLFVCCALRGASRLIWANSFTPFLTTSPFSLGAQDRYVVRFVISRSTTSPPEIAPAG